MNRMKIVIRDDSDDNLPVLPQHPRCGGSRPAPAYTLVVAGLDLGNGWVPVGNTGTAPVQLAACTISDASTHVGTFPSFVLAAGATVTVQTGAGTNTATSLYRGPGSSVWNNTGDTDTLKRPDGSVISSSTSP